MATTQQPLNPYIAGRAVGGERGFFGRQDILREVERTLTSPDQNALVLFGQRQIRVVAGRRGHRRHAGHSRL